MYQKDTSKLCIILTNNSFFLKEGDMEDQKIQGLQEELRTIFRREDPIPIPTGSRHGRYNASDHHYRTAT